ncbi:MAG: respiratory nitrate reductase subunit gamma [Deltaproteobacteria bacterium]|nr:respiratory nitrate reductase subunit gamma [Deltaproteobacteria bacterium]
MQTVYYLILVPMVYLAFLVFIAGTIIQCARIWRTAKNPTTLQVFPEKKPNWLWALHDSLLMPTIRRHYPLRWIILMIFHLALLLLIIGHLELFKGFTFFQFWAHEIFLGKGFVGLVLSIILLYLLFRRFHSPTRELSVPEDYYLLILLFLTVLFGAEMDWARRWYNYGELSPGDYQTYMTGLLVFKPELPGAVYQTGHSFMLVLHVFFANLFIMLFPFSKVMHSIFSVPMNKLRRG